MGSAAATAGSGARHSVAVAGCLLLAACFGVTTLVGPWSNASITDLHVYAYYSWAILHGQLPYQNFFFEYPPLAAPVLALGGIAGTTQAAYRDTFMWMMLLSAVTLLLCTKVVARRTGGNELMAVGAVAVSPLLLGAMVRTHFDLVPVALTMAALALVVAERPRLGLAVLGLAIAVKGFPVVVAVVAVPWLWRRAGRRTTLEASLALVVVVAAAVLAGIIVSLHGMIHSLTYQVTRPVEIESAAASALYTMGHLGFTFPHVVVAARSWGLAAPYAGVVAAVLELVGIAALGVIAVRTARRPDPQELVIGSLAALLVFMCAGKVLSPQYVIWAIPLFALAVAWRRWALAATAGAAMILTFAEFPSHFHDIVFQRTPWLLEVGARNLLLISAIWLCVRALGPEPHAVPAGEQLLSHTLGHAGISG